MVTGILEVEFVLHECRTLKEKRSVVKRIIERTRSRYRLSIAEVDHLTLYQRGCIGMAVVSNDRRYIHSLLDQVIDYIEGMCLVDVIDVRMEMV